MSADPRAALAQLVAALERHLEACIGRHGEDDPAVLASYDDLVDAFEEYDATLYEATGEVTPFDVDDDDDDDDDDGDDDDGDDRDEARPDSLDSHDDEDGDTDHVYSGLDDIDLD